MPTNGSAHPSPTAPLAPHEEGPARIVLVGRTGLDGVLAAPATTELVRVRTGADALGEVSAWKRNVRATGEQVVVLGEALDTDPTLLRARRFVEALRRLDPSARVLAVGRPLSEEGEGAEAFDGWLDIDDPVYSSRMLLQGKPGKRSAESRPEPTPPRAEAPTRPVEVPAPEPTPPQAAGDDRELVERLLHGEPISDAAIKLAARRTRAPLKLENASDAPPGPGRAPLPTMPDKVLVGPKATAEDLESAAAWLSSWLTLEQRQRDLTLQASTDALTGAWNRRSFDSTLARALEHARTARRDVSVLVFDIDDFKQYNDRYGHEAGDEILCEVVRLLRSVIRPSDRVCRIGGDEFAVIFDDPAGPREAHSRHPSSVVDVAHRFQSQVASQQFPKLGTEAPGRLTISGGLATFPWDGLDGNALLRVADQRALECKRQGKNAIELGRDRD